ncbi:hypothetical protein G7062_11425 [Erysipelothrix sp. HDW6C]|uniref:RusA family crossover junction endodeoxyribonuclease n=1 Tax=Erysipelothrix sp. HDW6C TaxID=2714930 RepID=UPI00140D3C5B|nr:RusA family crossover junction endodeoxyribonuclease [Erysipelothrix sp. HDW6C]QIK70868.1 hypothetical protein G7062_11425 [Erysipelothrix sp. HDW6C]
MKFTIPGKLDGLNDYTKSNRSNKYAGNKSKKLNELIILQALRKAKLSKVNKYPITLEITWHEPNKRRDVDNITFAVKFIQDAMVSHGIIEGDGQKYINQINHTVLVDKTNPRIEVEVIANEQEN